MRFQRLIAVLIVLIGSLGFAFGANQTQDLPGSIYIRNAKSEKIIVFVHGFLGDSISTWTNGSSYWPKMITADHDFDGVDVFVYQYPTSINADLTPGQVADDMRMVLKSNGVSDRKQLIFLSHSMGGIVTRAYLLNNRDIAEKTVLLQFYSTPTNGSSLGAIATVASRLGIWSNSQATNLSSNIEKNYLGNQVMQWQNARFSIPSYCAYEEDTTFGFKVVPFESATALCNALLTPVEANHFDIVKPLDFQSKQYLIFKESFKDAFARASSNQASPPSLVRNVGSMGGFSFIGNTVIGVGGTTVLDNAGSVGQVMVEGNYMYGAASGSSGAIVNNSGQIDQTSVSNNTIQLEQPLQETTNHGVITYDQQSIASMFHGVSNLWLDHAGAYGFGRLIGPSDSIGSMYVTDSDINLTATNAEGSRPTESNQLGQIGSVYVWGSRFKVDEAQTAPRQDMRIPFDVLNNHGVRNINGTFTSVITVNENIPAALDYLTIALRGGNILGLSVLGKPVNALAQVPLAGYAIVKLIKPSVPLTIAVVHSQAVCSCEGIVSWGVR
jgi:hypothetical protein